MKYYKITVTHDAGIAHLTVLATDEAAARGIVQKAEGCPSNAITSCVEQQDYFIRYVVKPIQIWDDDGVENFCYIINGTPDGYALYGRTNTGDTVVISRGKGEESEAQMYALKERLVHPRLVIEEYIDDILEDIDNGGTYAQGDFEDMLKTISSML